MEIQINKKKALLWGGITILAQMLIGNLLYMNPIVMNINKKFEGHSSLKSFDFIGGVGNWLLLMMIFGILLMIFWIYLYLKLYKSLPGKGVMKGIYFGLIIGMIKAVPEAFNQFMILTYPNELIAVQLVNTILGLVIFGILLSYFYSKFKVIT